MTHSSRTDRNARLFNLSWVTGVCALLFVVYVLSYAPVVAYCEENYIAMPDDLFDVTDGEELPFYRPVDVLVDSTPLRRPLFAWARIWNVHNTFIAGCQFRIVERE